MTQDGARAGESPLRVLIIEDSAEVVEAVSLCFRLRWPESNIVVSAEGKSGLGLLQSDRFDIMILDVGLPDMDGFQVIERAREFSIVPIIFLTVRSKPEDVARGLALGAADYIVKPFRAKDLMSRVSNVLSKQT